MRVFFSCIEIDNYFYLELLFFPLQMKKLGLA